MHIPPAVVLDAVTFGLHFLITGVDDLDSFRRSLVQQGLCRPSQDRSRLTLTLPDLEDGFTAELHLLWEAGRLVVKNSSTIRLNGLRLLRCNLGPEASGPVAFDGASNVIGPTVGRASELLALQLSEIEGVIDTLLDGLMDALPPSCEFLALDFWLQHAEACLDLPNPDPVGLVRSLQRVALSGAIEAGLGNYCAKSSESRTFPTIAWQRRKSGPVYKVYPKTTGLVRAEVSCRNRKAIRALFDTGEVSSDNSISGKLAVCMLTSFADLASPHLEDLVEHIASSITSTSSMADLAIALQPLTYLAASIHVGKGRPPTDATRLAAHAALDALLTTGRFDAKSLREGNSLKALLDRMAGSDGPLVKRRGKTVYTLQSRFTGAWRHLESPV